MDLAVFDWIDADLVDEVLGSSDARLRVARQSALDGLLLPMDRRGAVRRLHPLVRDYCTELLALENPVRQRGLHKRIAQAMAQRGHLMPACRHATAAGDSQLAGEFIETAGVFQMWLRGGPSRLLAMDRFLTPQVTALYPRCALLRSVVLRLKLRVDEARAQYASVSRATGDFSRDRDGGDADALAVDRIFTQAVLAGGSGQLLGGEFDKMRTAGGPDAASPVRDQGRHTLLCASHFERASFGGKPTLGDSGSGELQRRNAVRRCLRQHPSGHVRDGAGPGAGGHRALCGGSAGHEAVPLVRSLSRGMGGRGQDRTRSRAESQEGDPTADPDKPGGAARCVDFGLRRRGHRERRTDVDAVRPGVRHPASHPGARRGRPRARRELVASPGGPSRVPSGRGRTPRSGGPAVARPRAAGRGGRPARPRGAAVADHGGDLVRAHSPPGGSGRVCGWGGARPESVPRRIRAGPDPDPVPGPGSGNAGRSAGGRARTGCRNCWWSTCVASGRSTTSGPSRGMALSAGPR